MKTIAPLAFLLPLLLAPGCPSQHFEVTMQRTPEGRVERKLSLWTSDGGDASAPSESMLAQARKAYMETGETDRQKVRFDGWFTADLPADLENAGLLNRGVVITRTAREGTVTLYEERMPGQTNLIAMVRVGEQFADTLVRALVASAREHPELASDPACLEDAIHFLEDEARDDVLNVLLMVWLSITRQHALEEAGMQGNGESRCFEYGEGLRIADYLLERGYLRPAELSASGQVVMQAVLRGAVRKIAVLLGHPADGPWPAELERLAAPGADEEWGRVLEQGLTSIGVRKSEFDALLAPALPDFWGGSASGSVAFHCQTRPFLTNGTWDEKASAVTWEAKAQQGCLPPQMLYALWDEPARAFQAARFGKPVLEGHALFDYLGWRDELRDVERAAWDAFVDTLQPGPELIARLEQCRLPATTQPSSATTTPAGSPPRGAELLLAGLR